MALQLSREGQCTAGMGRQRQGRTCAERQQADRNGCGHREEQNGGRDGNSAKAGFMVLDTRRNIAGRRSQHVVAAKVRESWNEVITRPRHEPESPTRTHAGESPAQVNCQGNAGQEWGGDSSEHGKIRASTEVVPTDLDLFYRCRGGCDLRGPAQTEYEISFVCDAGRLIIVSRDASSFSHLVGMPVHRDEAR